MVSREKVILLAGGDVRIRRESPESTFAKVASVVREADIAFCNSEGTYSEKGQPQGTRTSSIVHPRGLSELKSAGIDVVSCANNHTMDAGPVGLLDTLELLAKNGIVTVGAGKNLEEARKPAIIERKGTRVAFLAYNSILWHGMAATETTPGVTPIWVYTHYEHVLFEQPGTQPKIVTFAYPEDVEAMREDIRKVRPLADVVVVSMHWGVQHDYAVLAMYEREVGHIAIDEGADVILGGHQHVLKGIEVYKGKVIFYGLAHLALHTGMAEKHSPMLSKLLEFRKLKLVQDPEWALYPLPPESRKTILAKITISDGQIERVSFMPMMINKQCQPNILTREDKDFQEVVEYVKDITKDQGLDTKFSVEGNEVVVSG